MEKTVTIGLLGFGTVGAGVVRVLKENAYDIRQKVGAPVQIKTVLVRDKHKARPYMENLHLTDDFEEILQDDGIDIIVELMGGLQRRGSW